MAKPLAEFVCALLRMRPPKAYMGSCRIVSSRGAPSIRMVGRVMRDCKRKVTIMRSPVYVGISRTRANSCPAHTNSANGFAICLCRDDDQSLILAAPSGLALFQAAEI